MEGRGRLSNLSKITELVNGKLWVLGLGKENKLKGEKLMKKYYVS